MLCYTEKTPRLSLPFSSEWSISSLQQLPLVLAGGEGSLEFFTTRLRGVVARVDFLSAIQVGSRFEAGFPIVWMFIWIDTWNSSHYLCFSTVFTRHEKMFCLGKVRTERKGKGPGRAWGIFPVKERRWDILELQWPGTQASGIVSLCTMAVQKKHKADKKALFWTRAGGFHCGKSCCHSHICSSEGLMQKGHFILTLCLWDSPLSSLLLALIAFITATWPIYFCFINSFQMVCS